MTGKTYPLNAYLILQRVQASPDRSRSYAITIRSMEIERPVYVVQLQWGHPGEEQRTCQIICTDQSELKQMLRQILRTRLRFGYQIVERSHSFPETDLLERFKVAELTGERQLPLF